MVTEFQSLFYWILFLRQKVADFAAEFLKFQSLFYWILFLRKIKPEIDKIVDQSFNPCFIGFCS